jgi:hypothetical protein
VQMQEFGGRQPFVEAEIFREEPDFSPNFNVARGHAQHKCLAAGGPGEAQKHFDRSAFARPVRAKKAEYFSPAHGQGQVAHRDFAPENLAQILRLDRLAIELGQRQLLFVSD